MPINGIVSFAAASIACLQSMQTHIINIYTRFAPSAIRPTVLLRRLAGFSFPLFAWYMYDMIGYGWGNSVLGFVDIVIGIPAPLILWNYVKKLKSTE